MSRCQRECQEFDPPILLQAMPQWRKILGRRICSRDRLVAGSTPVWGTILGSVAEPGLRQQS
jgi:hypothetical protein